MAYLLRLPRQAEIRRLAQYITSFPATTEYIIQRAKQLDLSTDLQYFLRQFYQGNRPEVFDSRADFFTRATELAMLIKEEREQPKETLLSPQG